MNKNERDRLAKHCAKMKYGQGADRTTNGYANDILADFPDIKLDFEIWSEIFAMYRLKNLLIIVWQQKSRGPYGSSLKNSDTVMLNATGEIIEEMLELWAEDNSPLSRLIDDDEDLTLITNSASWNKLCEKMKEAGRLSDKLFEIMRGDVGDNIVSP